MFIATVAVLLSMRGDSTPDTAAYRDIYKRSSENLNYEFLYMELNRFSNGIGMSFDVFLFLLTLTLFFSWYRLTSSIINNMFIAFITFLPFYGLYFFGITLRASMAVLVSYLGIIILLKNRKVSGYLLYFICVFIASGFHQTALAFLFLPVVYKKFSKKWLYGFLLITASLPLFNNYIPFIQDITFRYLETVGFSRVEGYVTRGPGVMTYSLSLIMNLVFAGVFISLKNRIIFKNHIYDFFLNIYLIGCFLISLFSFVTAGSRLGFMFLFFEFILLTLLYESSNINKHKLNLLIMFSVIINFVGIILKGNGLLW